VIGSGSLGNPGPTWHENDCGEAFLWTTNGTGITGAGSLGNPGLYWHVKVTGDFDGDRNPDLLWQNDTGEGVYLGTERDHPDRCRQPRQSGPGPAHHFGRILQPRWSIGHPVAEQ
jgi:hypothetical protein